MTQQPFLSIEHLSMQFSSEENELRAIADINLQVQPGEFITIIGPSGSGKSTLLRILAGVLQPSDGKFSFSPEPNPERAIVFQNSNLMPWFNVIDNIALPLRIRGMAQHQAQIAAREWISKVGLDGFEKEWPKNLSGGMAQRVAIARALIQSPQLLLMDEPFGALDSLTRYKTSMQLMHVWDNICNNVILVTHSITESILLADRVLVFSQRPGRIIYEQYVDFPRPRAESLPESVEFIQLRKKLRSILDQNSSK